MKITSLSERQRRTDARQRARSPSVHAPCSDSARRPTSEAATEGERLEPTSAHEPQPPRTATARNPHAVPATAIPPSVALQVAEDEGWPTAHGN